MLSQLKRLSPYLARYRLSYALGAVCVVLTVALRFAVPYLLGDSIDLLRQASLQPEPLGAAEQEELRRLIVAGAVGMVVATALGAAVRMASRLLVLGNSRRAAHDVRGDLFARLLVLAPTFYVRHRTGHIMSRAVNDMQNVQGLLGPVFMYLVETGVLFAVGLAFMWAADPVLTMVGLLPFPFFLARARRLARQVQIGSREGQEKLGEVSAKVDESLSGHRVIKSLVLEDEDRRRFDRLSNDYSRTMLDVARLRATMGSLMTFLAALSTFLVLAAGIGRAESGAVTVGELVSLVLYLGMLAAPIRTLGFVLSSLQRGAAALQRIGELLDLDETVPEGVAGSRPIAAGSIAARHLRVEFAASDELPHLSDSLGPEAPAGSGRRLVLEDVSFEVPAGSTVGIVGPVGAGKTTLLRALLRQVAVPRGTVLLDGIDICDVPLADLRAAVSMAPQDGFLFSDTLANNVRFGVPEASREQVQQAVETAHLDEDLDQLPHGLDTMLGERGVNLSGGQRQRTALARVSLLRPRVLLLDDTLSAVDTHTADAILTRLRPLMVGRTTIVVSHRLSTVQDLDQILVLQEGRITERGRHDELLALGGYYASIYRTQSTREGLVRELGLEEAS